MGFISPLAIVVLRARESLHAGLHLSSWAANRKYRRRLSFDKTFIYHRSGGLGVRNQGYGQLGSGKSAFPGLPSLCPHMTCSSRMPMEGGRKKEKDGGKEQGRERENSLVSLPISMLILQIKAYFYDLIYPHLHL